jgi:hypothetical protein
MAAQFRLGDQVLFRSGDTFYGRLTTTGGLNPNGSLFLLYGSYGSGQRPILSQYKVCNIASGWTLVGTNVWRLNYTAANVGVSYTGDPTGALGVAGYDVGFVKINGANDTGLSLKGQIYGNKKFSTAALAQQWDFYSDFSNGLLYIYSVGRPTSAATDIRIATGGWSEYPTVSPTSGICLHNLAFHGNGGHAVDCANVNWVQVINSVIGECGGSRLYVNSGDTTTYGNGFSFANVNQILVAGNVIRDNYNTPFTLQGGAFYNNVVFTKNVMYRNTQGPEYDFQGSGPGFTNCVDQYNTSIFEGYGWTTQGSQLAIQNPCHQLTYEWDMTAPPQLAISKNAYYDAAKCFAYSYSLSTSSAIDNGYNSKNNWIGMRSGALMQSADQDMNYTIDNPAPWVSLTGREQGSKFAVLGITTPAPPAASTTATNAATDAQVTAALAAVRSAAPAFGIAGSGLADPVLV